MLNALKDSIFNRVSNEHTRSGPPVPLWSRKDVRKWMKNIGFNGYKQKFYDEHIDGDLLLQLTGQMLFRQFGMTNEIQRTRFERELHRLKQIADYSSMDPTNLSEVLMRIGPDYNAYTYAMVRAGVTRQTLSHLTEVQLTVDCGITNSIHRRRILNFIEYISSTSNIPIPVTAEDASAEKGLDVFISYRRSNGSQLASLLKVNLQLRGFSVFIDVEGLEAGQFDNNLLLSIQRARYFLLVLTPGALDRCCDDLEGNDWVHREIAAALQSKCDIIPIIDKFEWPLPEELPEDMRGVCNFNGVNWIHDYQGACIDKLERFMRDESDAISEIYVSPWGSPGNMALKQRPFHFQQKPSSESGQSNMNLSASKIVLASPKAKNKNFQVGGSMMDLRAKTSPVLSKHWRSQTPIMTTRRNNRPIMGNGNHSYSLQVLLDDDQLTEIHEETNKKKPRHLHNRKQ